MRTVSKRNKRWIAAALCVSLLATGVPAITANATVGYGIEELYDDTVWMGWTYYESGNAGYASCGDSGQAYGRYQMDYRSALEGFLDFCLAVDSKKYSMLAPYAALPSGDEGLKGENVNIVVHGHDPALSEMICEYADSPEMIAYAKEQGAKGITVSGVCCTSNEVAMRRG